MPSEPKSRGGRTNTTDVIPLLWWLRRVTVNVATLHALKCQMLQLIPTSIFGMKMIKGTQCGPEDFTLRTTQLMLPVRNMIQAFDRSSLLICKAETRKWSGQVKGRVSAGNIKLLKVPLRHVVHEISGNFHKRAALLCEILLDTILPRNSSTHHVYRPASDRWGIEGDSADPRVITCHRSGPARHYATNGAPARFGERRVETMDKFRS